MAETQDEIACMAWLKKLKIMGGKGTCRPNLEKPP
jgi:hypothetical protein